MSNFAILTDSCCDLPAKLVTELDIHVLPLSFTLKGESYQNHWDNRAMSPEEFYGYLRRGEMSSTSAVNVGQYHEVMEEELIAGRDILVLSFSAALSTSCQSAQIAAEELKEQYPNRMIFVVDTRCASMGQGLLVYLAAQKRQQGMSLEAVRDWVEATKGQISHQFTVDELGFLKRGGRISAATAVVGTMLAVKPLLHVDDEGKLVSVGKARGRSTALKALVTQMEQTVLPENDTIFIAHGDCAEEITPMVDTIREKFPHAHLEIGCIGPVIGAHTGPGIVAVFFLGSQR